MANISDNALAWEWANSGDIQYITVPKWSRQGVKAGFTSRQGGCSQPPYQSLNLGLHVGDQAERVLFNRRALAGAFGSSLGDMVCCQQVHGCKVALIDRDMAGLGSEVYGSALPGHDAMICNTPGLLLATFYADCFPIFFFDPVQRAVGLAHSGWKGVMCRIAARTVEEMEQHFSSRPEDIQVLIGPGIQRCCFEIGDELFDKVRQEFSSIPDIIYSNDNGYRWDLPETIRQTLYRSGISENNLLSCDLCTSCRTDLFFSYRQEGGVTGRMAAVIGLE
ncbi:MAG: peptidoglycan editing factor PgeF [Deltaproteobacteria bacterium]